MHSFQILCMLMAFAVVLVFVALKVRIPYPLALVVGGALLGFIPGLGELELDPEIVLVTVLPPILYYAAFSIQFKEFQKNISDILFLALGLVAVTTLVVGCLFKWLFPELPWALAFTFGAIVSPPDAVAAIAILRRFATGSRLITVLEGESLINDATGLVLYRLALVALLSGTFSWADASVQFLQVTGGGILVGVVVGYAIHRFTSRFFDPVLAVVASFIIPYLTYLIADALEVSGILAVVMTGLIGSRMLISEFSALTRVVGWAAWDVFIIFLNCFVFMLIGWQLQGVVQRLTLEKAALYLGYGFLITLAIMAVRFMWVYAIKGASCFSLDYDCKPRNQLMQEACIIGWAGMRGIVSLTLALALPFRMMDGAPLPGRDIVIFLTFVIIFFTLLLPGLTLTHLLKWLKMGISMGEYDTSEVRKELVKTAKEEIQKLYEGQFLTDEEYEFLLNYFHSRHQILEITSKEKITPALEAARLKVLNKKRQRLLQMWEENEIGDELFSLAERELDLEEAQLARAILH